MATLVHPTIIPLTPLDSSIPTPFPREQLGQIRLELSKGKAVDKPDVRQEEGTAENPFENEVDPSTLAESGIATPNTYTLVRNLVFCFLFCFLFLISHDRRKFCHR
jgi:hypothetical protein